MVRSSKVRREVRGDGISTGGEEEQGEIRKKERGRLRRENSTSFAFFSLGSCRKQDRNVGPTIRSNEHC